MISRRPAGALPAPAGTAARRREVRVRCRTRRLGRSRGVSWGSRTSTTAGIAVGCGDRRRRSSPAATVETDDHRADGPRRVEVALEVRPLVDRGARRSRNRTGEDQCRYKREAHAEPSHRLGRVLDRSGADAVAEPIQVTTDKICHVPQAAEQALRTKFLRSQRPRVSHQMRRHSPGSAAPSHGATSLGAARHTSRPRLLPSTGGQHSHPQRSLLVQGAVVVSSVAAST
jgi:hypothetical protein